MYLYGNILLNRLNTIEPENFRSEWKSSDAVQIQFYKNHLPEYVDCTKQSEMHDLSGKSLNHNESS
jgi:hypothetical protein